MPTLQARGLRLIVARNHHSNYAGRVATKADKGRSDSTDSSAAVAKKLDTVVILALAVVCTKTL